MYYRLEKKLSPNYTRGADSQRAYGRKRTFDAGAGHWWGLWQSNYSHAGVVNTFLNPARQGSANEVISDRLVTLMVEYPNIAWTTNNANPFTYSYEVDPQIMHRWRSGASKAQKDKANRIFETVAQRMADTGKYTKPWYPHKKWWSTQCNDIRWNEIITRAKAIIKERQTPKPPKVTWIAMDTPRQMLAIADLRVKDMDTGKYIGKVIKKGTKVDIATKTPDSKWLRSKYSTTKALNHGLERSKFGEVPVPPPEWVKNMFAIKPVKLMVLPKQTQVFHLETLKAITPLAQGTWIDFTHATTVKGKAYLISKYSATKTLPNGILESEVGIPPTPVPEKPEWLKNWRDIEDVTMYTRSDAPVVDLLNGKTLKTIPRGTAIEIASATEWHDQEYLITKYSTTNNKPHGISLVDLDMKPVEEEPEPVVPVEPNPIEERVKVLEKLVKEILAFLTSIFARFKRK